MAEVSDVIGAKPEPTALLDSAAKKVAHALQRLAEATSTQLGGDCLLHAELGQQLMADEGYIFEVKVGAAAWRVGSGDGDVLAHFPGLQGYMPLSTGTGVPYHAWLESPDWILDFTTYQIPRKARILDASDGGHTNVEWRPSYLLIARTSLRAYHDVAQATCVGMVYYQSNSMLAEVVKPGFNLDAGDLATARLLVSNEHIEVIGPNNTAAHQERLR